MKPEPSSAPLPSQQTDALLRVVASEMAKLVQLTLELQEVNPAVQAGGRRAEDIKAYQSLDYVTQSLQALTSVCQDMALNTPAEWTHEKLESIDQVTLAELKTALKSGRADSIKAASDGVVDLFDC